MVTRFTPSFSAARSTLPFIRKMPFASMNRIFSSRSSRVMACASPSGWRDAFLAAGEANLASRPADGERLESERLKARLGEMLLREELLEAKIAALEANRPLARRRPKP